MDKTICRAQKQQFSIMRCSSFNCFNGKKVVKSLEENKNLWIGAIFGRFEHWEPTHQLFGVILRDIQDDIYNADTLLLTCPTEAEEELERLAKTWDADEVDWINIKHAGRVLRVWWD